MSRIIKIKAWTIDLDNFSSNDFRFNAGFETILVDGKQVERMRVDVDYESWQKALEMKVELDEKAHKVLLVAAFKKRGIYTAEIEFSGGNDEGGADSIGFYDKNDEDVEVERHYHSTQIRVDDKWVQRELSADELEENAFLELVEAPLFWKFGTFAGDFSVSGILRYTLDETKKYRKMSYSESVYVDREEFSKD
jgi:hypothetical protein